ncbi:MAG: hypothetical protein IJ262_07320 [Clostridia bacterium]|nr:hypothetical protein [Clostridia bacterium]
MTKRIKLLIVAVIIAAVVSSAIIVPQYLSETVKSDISFSARTNNEPLYVAHRGLSSLCPQNTLPAFEAAAEYGFYGYELDVHTTADGKWVVIHNDTVDSMTNGEGEVEKFTFDEIRKLKIDSGNGIENHRNLQIPTLEESLEICKRSNIIPFIEIKKCDVKYMQGFIEILNKFGIREKCVVISFNFDYLLEVQKYSPETELMYLISKPTMEAVDRCAENGKIGFDFNYKKAYMRPGVIKYAKEKGLKLGAWTVDNTIDCDLMRAFGVEIITTNRILP